MPASDTIAALATAVGRSAIAVIRLSGLEVPRIGAQLLGQLPRPRLATRIHPVDGGGEIIDHALGLFFPAPHSFTGEHVLELHVHGGAAVIDSVMQRLFGLGARPALPGEFSERAFLNGKMDLAQAEAVADLIDASSSAAARAALRSLSGEFSRRIHALAEEVVALRVRVEAGIDFSEEDIGAFDSSQLQARVLDLAAAIDSLLANARQGVVLREGLQVVLAGEPNVGKSSLLNALSREAVAIVAEIPGTTRDVLRQDVRIDGATLTLIDTAGLRDAHGPIEREGVRRAKAAMQRADHILLVVDARHPQFSEELKASLPSHVASTVIVNKLDLVAARGAAVEGAVHCSLDPTSLHVSALTGEGLPALHAHLRTLAGHSEAEAGVFTARRRHVAALDAARLRIRAAASLLEQHAVLDLVAEELRLAHGHLGEITGTVGSDDLLGEIFSSFCIGK